ncbi:Nucleoporin nup44 OS=Schizosaccharomyces pombe (strain 972 / ATCC 24843) GN=nup44 PE=2 SV=1 [Rhizoctonia solani AG-1 IB]|uniref:Nucleoporin nup44 n=1 Tax=Thanatephorus cucumeris (strain AG1-IB / isolate 7/3/14) TaxID=1108050 RepID=A0A0B7F6U9_THACB|nr:Nucleoporin nup44 OS=Schizosaccharomyces pombe (strain 972 / ATCC 24843) GN=nup44 PE=2 SV=1 [Rhizoctonia solani AG-1 IB]
MAFSFGQPSTSTSTTAPAPAFGGSTFSFGANNNTNAAGTTGASGGTGLFGQATTTQPGAGTGTGLFGNTGTTGATGTTGGGLFGNTNTTNTGTGTTGGLFGNNATNAAATTAPATGGLFGAANTNTTGTTGGGLFGNPNNAAAPASGGLFGSTTTAPTATTGGGLFGNTTTQQPSGGLFASTTTAPSGGLFGAKPAGPSLFGQPATNTLAQSTLSASTLGPPVAQPAKNNLQVSVFGTPGAGGLTIEQRIEAIYQAWSPGSPDCRFQYYFYNLVENPQAYGRPMNATNEALWKRAISENPNPERLVPALAIGFDDLKKRALSQQHENQSHIAALAQLRTRLTAVTAKHDTTRLARLAQTHTELSRRVRALARQLHMLIPAVRRSALAPEEEELRRKLLALEEGAGLARLAGRMNELWAMAGSVQARGKETAGGRVEWAVVDEEGLASIAQILKDQQNGLAHVTKILQDDLRALKIIQEGVPTHN